MAAVPADERAHALVSRAPPFGRAPSAPDRNRRGRAQAADRVVAVCRTRGRARGGATETDTRAGGVRRRYTFDASWRASPQQNRVRYGPFPTRVVRHQAFPARPVRAEAGFGSRRAARIERGREAVTRRRKRPPARAASVLAAYAGPLAG